MAEDINQLLEEVMIFEIETGRMAKIRMTSAFLQKMRDAEKFFESDGHVAGVLCEIDDNLESYVIENID